MNLKYEWGVGKGWIGEGNLANAQSANSRKAIAVR
jgi:hypothetical protein